MPYIITDPCRGTCDASCINVCPVDCIYPPEGYTTGKEDLAKMRAANEQMYIHPDECIDCGACEPECPVEAIYPQDEVPEKWQHYIEINYRRFGLKP